MSCIYELEDKDCDIAKHYPCIGKKCEYYNNADSFIEINFENGSKISGEPAKNAIQGDKE
jgi:hypothetical protein